MTDMIQIHDSRRQEVLVCMFVIHHLIGPNTASYVEKKIWAITQHHCHAIHLSHITSIIPSSIILMCFALLCSHIPFPLHLILATCCRPVYQRYLRSGGGPRS